MSHDPADGISRRKFLSLSSGTALAPVALSLTSATQAAISDSTAPQLSPQQVALPIGYTWLPGSDSSLSSQPVVNAASFSCGNPALVNRPLRLSLHGLNGLSDFDLTELQIDVTRRCAIPGCGVIEHNLWSSAAGAAQSAAASEFTYVPTHGEHLTLDLRVQGLVRKKGSLGQRLFSGRTFAQSAALNHASRVRLSLGAEARLAKLNTGVYFIPVPGLSHQTDFAGSSCKARQLPDCQGFQAQDAFDSELPEHRQTAYFSLSVTDAA